MRAHPPISRRPSLVRRAVLAGVCALGLASNAAAVGISNLSVALDAGNTLDLFDGTAPNYSQIESDVAVLGSSPIGFTTRYQAGVYADGGGGFGAVTTVSTLNAAYTISFDVTDALGSAWRLDVATSRVGARTA